MTDDSPSAHYDKITQAWGFLLGEDLHYGYFHSPDIDLPTATGELSRQMAASGQLGSIPDASVLDVGCGTGSPGCWLGKTYGVSVVGISTSPVGIEKANARAKSVGLSDTVEFEVRDAQDNGFEADRFDHVWVMESPHLMPDKPAMLREGARVLKQGGHFVLCDIIAKEPISLSVVLKHAKAFDLLRRVYGRAKMETLAFYGEHLEKGGLTVTDSRDISTEVRPTFARWRDNAKQNKAEVVALIGEQAWKDFAESCDILQDFWDQGVLGYGLIAAQRK